MTLRDSDSRIVPLKVIARTQWRTPVQDRLSRITQRASSQSSESEELLELGGFQSLHWASSFGESKTLDGPDRDESQVIERGSTRWNLGAGCLTRHVRFWEGAMSDLAWIEVGRHHRGNYWQTVFTYTILNRKGIALLARRSGLELLGHRKLHLPDLGDVGRSPDRTATAND